MKLSYIEIYNGTDSAIDLAANEFWILANDTLMTWEPIYNTQNEEWETEFWVLPFKSDNSMTSGSLNLQIDDDYVQRVDARVLNPNESLMIARTASEENFDFVAETTLFGIKFLNWRKCACAFLRTGKLSIKLVMIFIIQMMNIYIQMVDLV